MVDNQVMRELSEKYSEMRSKISSLTNASELTDIEIAERLRISLPSYLIKKANADWTEKQVQRILYIIDNEELEDFYLGKIMENVEKENEFMTLDELKKGVARK
ncbi:MAG: hypothetical protein ABIN80_14405 [Dyadobacter sp.]|uniref:hypothetical protein n=1 Tax=Dyadobacter sp. TaxID=1914288 RepID=UPI003264E9B5